MVFWPMWVSGGLVVVFVFFFYLWPILRHKEKKSDK